MLARLLCVTIASALAGCALSIPPQPNSTSLTYLVRQTPEAALDSVEAWTEDDPAFVAARAEPFDAEPSRLVVYDGRPGQENRAYVDARGRPDGLTEVHVQSRYVAHDPTTFQDIPTSVFLGLGSRGTELIGLPTDGSEACRSPDELAPRSPQTDVAQRLPERQPVLIGGLEGLRQRVRYPESMRRSGIEGVVFVSFVVGVTGNVECANVVSTPNPVLSDAAREAVAGSTFEPGIQRGEPVRVAFTLPIRFMLH